ncbi:MAG: putative toxin-antitoxin system toxin component, PIN family [Acidobacteria bacterium]|nr:putative toxin-antitoxin system toxin component, PIN family [Acidobacteriota bacterium]MBI3427230.1 putative toxin-antitoxin system toxin component, PIN family [Acidobacteriota bacterium]
MFRIVIDTNVVIAALRSQRGASYRLLMMLEEGRWQTCLSVPLLMEYEAVAKRPEVGIKLSDADIDIFLDYVCGWAEHRQIYFLWRPLLPDPGDDCVLEVAVEAQCDFIVTYNRRDFVGAERFGLAVVTPPEFLRKLEESK